MTHTKKYVDERDDEWLTKKRQCENGKHNAEPEEEL